MRRAAGCLGLGILLILSAIGLLWPVMAQVTAGSDASAVSDPVTFTSYRADLSVAPDGLLTARETIVADFPLLRHGIFRFWDRRDAADPHHRYTPTVTSITMDGGPVPYEVTWQDGDRYVVAKIGDPDSYLDRGEHTYVIDYTIPGSLSPGSAGMGDYASSDGDVSGQALTDFYWNVVAPGWRNQIDRAAVVVTLPSPALGVECTAGSEGPSGLGPCAIAGTGTDRVTLGAEGIPPVSGMTTRIPLAIPTPPRDSVPWTVLFDKVLGTTVLPVLLVVALTIGAIALAVGWSSTTRESAPGLPVMYAPPEGMGPVQTVYLVQEDTGRKPLVATVLRMADLGLVTLEHRSDDSWLVTGRATPDQWALADPASRAVAAALGLTAMPGMWFLSDGSKAAGSKLLDAQKSIDSAVKSWSVDAGLMVKDRGAQRGCAVWGLAFLLAVVGFIGWRWPTMWGLPGAAFAVAGLAFVNPKAMTRRSDAGRRAWSEAGGFRRMLATPSSEERFDFSARKDLFIPYVPYAVAFGVADAWAKKYRDETHEDPPVPAWYPLGAGYAYSSFYSGGAFDSFDSSVNSAIGAYQASQSSSGGGGGGGSFGGGGGGGGGGSW